MRSLPTLRSLSILVAAAFMLLAGPAARPGAAGRDAMFDDPLFRRCIGWMLDGYRGAMLQNVCLEEFELPPPSLFLCARKIRLGFASPADREGCALVFEENARRAREGYVK
jgi:hypothetical protein